MKKSNLNTSISKRRTHSTARGVAAYFDLRNESFQKVYKAARDYYSIEGIHELRVEIKRLRALYRLVEYIAPAFTAKPNLSSLKPLFRAAGELRDIDICQAITMESLKKLDIREYYNHLKFDELRLRAEYRKIAPPNISKVGLPKARPHIYSATRVATDVSTRRRMNKKIIKQTNKLLDAIDRKKPGRDELHSIRKAAKALRYYFDIWQQCYGKSRELEVASVSIKNTYGYLGEWRDYTLTSESVNTFIRNKSAKYLIAPSAYVTFKAKLSNKIKSLLASYKHSKIELKISLKRVLVSLKDQMPENTKII